MTMRPLHAGDGYTYLTRHTASGDTQRASGDPLVDYYTASGEPPGRWAGAGCGDLGMAGEVTEEHMLALFGEGLHPEANDIIAERIDAGADVNAAIKAARLGRRVLQFDQDVPAIEALKAAYSAFARDHLRRPTVAERHDLKTAVGRRLLQEETERPVTSEREIRKYLQDELGKARQPVSGFDLVFAPAKSVSLLWALGGHEIRAIVESAHHEAWQTSLAYGEQEAALTRVGAGGIAQIETTGFVATAFQHRDSRAGDPHLHTHVAVANRVRGIDGVWRTIDGQQLFRVAVSISETYNALIEQLLTERLGVSWVKRAPAPGKRAVYEVAGIPAEWIRGFSKRHAQVELAYDDLLRDYVARHGHTPPRSVQLQLVQQAQLGPDRPDKDPDGVVPLAEQVHRWIAEAADLTPGRAPHEVVESCAGAGASKPVADANDLRGVAKQVIAEIEENRASWTVYHVRAEALRQLRPFAFSAAAQRREAAARVVEHALSDDSVQLDLIPDSTPQLLRRGDGDSVFHRRGSTRYTSEELLAAEERLLQDSRRRRGPIVRDSMRRRTVRSIEKISGKTLNAGQCALVEHFVSSGSALAVAIGPPGAGKSTAMRAVRSAWETTGGRIIGLAPSAAAASVLGDELTAGDDPTDASAVRSDTVHSLNTRYLDGDDIDVRPGDMLLVDEAGMAGTRQLDLVREIAETHGAVVRLVGDYRQLGAVEAGGALRLLHHDAGGVELTEVRRFARADEAEAVLNFRVGNHHAVDFYDRNNRLHGGIRAAVLDQLYIDWERDLADGSTSIMISDSSDVARELSVRAQMDRRARSLVTETGIELDGFVIGVGDRVVTRLNRRRWTMCGGKDFVKNGDLWTVTQIHNTGGIDVRHVRHGGRMTLPARYVAQHVELGYAATIHRAQGLTVDVSRSFLTSAATRESALVALSRGVHSNHAYFDVEEVLSVDEPGTLPGELFRRSREASAAVVALTSILDREGNELSATEQLREALDTPYSLRHAVDRYAYALLTWRGDAGTAQAEQWVRTAIPEHAENVIADEAWPALQSVLHEARDAGAEPVDLLRARARARALTSDLKDPAESVAKVLHYRVTAAMPAPLPGPDRSELLPGWVATPPVSEPSMSPGDLEFAELGSWLRDRADEIADRVLALGELVAESPPIWAGALGPVPGDPVGREWWVARAGQVAAYRERWAIPDTAAELLPEGGRAEQARARSWVVHYLLRTARVPGADTDRGKRISARTRQARQRVDALTARLTRPAPAHHRALPEPDPAAPIHDRASGAQTIVPVDPGPDLT